MKTLLIGVAFVIGIGSAAQARSLDEAVADLCSTESKFGGMMVDLVQDGHEVIPVLCRTVTR